MTGVVNQTGARSGIVGTVVGTPAAGLPLSGGAMTGAITTNSTFDGIDIATRDAVLTSTTTTATAANVGRPNGPFIIGNSGTYASGSNCVKIDTNAIINSSRSGTGGLNHILFNNSNGGVGSIWSSGSNTNYGTGSDYRLKENVIAMSDSIDRLKLLKPSRFNFISDSDITLDGFLAHEAQTVVPEAIYGEKDAMTEAVLYIEGDELPEGKSIGDIKTASIPDMQGIDPSKFVPLLVGALQEAIARIETLENA